MSLKINHMIFRLSKYFYMLSTLRKYNRNLPYQIFRAFLIETKLYTYTFPFLLYPLNHISFLASIYITVAMAYERYIAVCKPLHYRDVTSRYTVQRRTFGCVISDSYMRSYIIICLVKHIVCI